MISLTNKWSEIVFHFIFWVGFLTVSSSLTIEIFGTEKIVGRVACVALSFAIIVYSNLYIFLPYLFFKHKYGWYTLTILSAVGITTAIRIRIDTHYIGSEHALPVDTGSFTHYIFIILTYILILFITSTYKFIKHTYELTHVEQEMTNYKLEAELKFLKAQVNPHFLFNSLNNIYSLNQYDHEKSSEMILKLSDMMRYMLYEANEKKVPLAAEIKYLKNYIELNQMRTREKQNVNLELSGNVENMRIEPMFFIPLLENSYKHGNLEDATGWIKCEINLGDQTINFKLSNTTSKVKSKKDKVGGVGLENIRKRLALLYPERYKMITYKENGIFTAELSIDLN